MLVYLFTRPVEKKKEEGRGGTKAAKRKLDALEEELKVAERDLTMCKMKSAISLVFTMLVLFPTLHSLYGNKILLGLTFCQAMKDVLWRTSLSLLLGLFKDFLTEEYLALTTLIAVQSFCMLLAQWQCDLLCKRSLELVCFFQFATLITKTEAPSSPNSMLFGGMSGK